MRTKGLREFKRGCVSYKEEYKRILNYEQWKFNILNRGGIITAHMGKGNYSYGLLGLNLALVVLTLAVVDYCWLLLVANGCWMIASCGWDTACRGKVFEYFRDVDDLRLRQFCRQKILWIFSKRRRRILATTSLQIVLEFFEEAMRKFD